MLIGILPVASTVPARHLLHRINKMPRQLRPRHPTTGLAFRPELGRFGVLPRELRDQIYSYLYGGWHIDIKHVVSDDGDQYEMFPIDVRSKFVNDGCGSIRTYPNDIVDSLLVSRRFSEEVAHTLYSTNCFEFNMPESLQLFVDQIPARHRECITKVSLSRVELRFFDNWRLYWRDRLRALLSLHGIKYLTIFSILGASGGLHRSHVVGERSVEMRESKLFPKLEHANVRCCYYIKQFRTVAEIHLEEVQKFLAGDSERPVG